MSACKSHAHARGGEKTGTRKRKRKRMTTTHSADRAVRDCACAGREDRTGCMPSLCVDIAHEIGEGHPQVTSNRFAGLFLRYEHFPFVSQSAGRCRGGGHSAVPVWRPDKWIVIDIRSA